MTIESSKYGQVVVVTVWQSTAKPFTHNAYVTLGTIDSEYRPSRSIPFLIYDNSANSGSNAIALGRINNAGVIEAWFFSDAPTNNAPRGTIVYILD